MGEPPSAELGGQSVIAADMPLKDADMDECPLVERTGTRRPATPPVGGHMTKQTARQSANDNGRHATNGVREMAPSDPGNDKALLQRLQGDLRRLAPVLEQVVGALRAVQSSITEDKRTAVASATVRHEVKVASEAVDYCQTNEQIS